MLPHSHVHQLSYSFFVHHLSALSSSSSSSSSPSLVFVPFPTSCVRFFIFLFSCVVLRQRREPRVSPPRFSCRCRHWFHSSTLVTLNNPFFFKKKRKEKKAQLKDWGPHDADTKSVGVVDDQPHDAGRCSSIIFGPCLPSIAQRGKSLTHTETERETEREGEKFSLESLRLEGRGKLPSESCRRPKIMVNPPPPPISIAVTCVSLLTWNSPPPSLFF